MKYSKNYNFNLPQKADKDVADIDFLNENFEKIDEVLGEVQNITAFEERVVLILEKTGLVTLARAEDGSVFTDSESNILIY